MSTTINHYNGNILTILQDNSIDTNSSSLTLPGRFISNYGSSILENLVWNVQHFNNNLPPSNPLIGQNWYDTSLDIMKVWNGNAWISDNGIIISNNKPIKGFNPSAGWYDVINQQLNIWNGGSFDLIGPIGSAINNDPISNTPNSAAANNSNIDAIQIADKNNIQHEAIRITIGGTVVAIISKDPVYTTYPVITGFLTISPGINLNATIVEDNRDKTIFKSTQNNLPDVDGIRNLGSANFKFDNFYTYNTSFYQKLIIGNTNNSSDTLQVTGSSLFENISTINGQGIFQGGSTTTPPLILKPNTLIMSPQLGAIEYDGTNLYITVSNSSTISREPILLGNLTSSGTWGFIFNGTPNSITVTCNPEPELPIPVNTIVSGVLVATNTSSTVTMQVSNSDPAPVLFPDGSLPPVGTLIANHIIQFVWNGTNWIATTDLTANGLVGANTSYLPLSGGSMSGFPVLPGDPTLPLQALTKQYVDNQNTIIENQLSTLTTTIGNINFGNYVPLAGATVSGPITLVGDPPGPSYAATKNYVDYAFQHTNLANYLPLSGGTLLGELLCANDKAPPTHALTKVNVDEILAQVGGPAGLLNCQFFYQQEYLNPQADTSITTVSQTYKPTAGTTKILTIITSGGGGGGGLILSASQTNYTRGGNGGAGSTVIAVCSVSDSSTYTVKVGAGGYPGNPTTTSQQYIIFSGHVTMLPANSSATAGGNSNIVELGINILGGSPGTNSTNYTNGTSGNGGIITSSPPGAFSINGNSGGDPSASLSASNGSSFWGGFCTIIGNSPNFGSGGGGRYSSGGAGVNGIVNGIGVGGGSGIVIILEYK